MLILKNTLHLLTETSSWHSSLNAFANLKNLSIAFASYSYIYVDLTERNCGRVTYKAYAV